MGTKLRTALCVVLFFIAGSATADSFNVGYISYNLTNATGSSAGTTQFEITNNTGANSSDSADFPILDALTLNNLSLSVQFANLTISTFNLGSSDPLFSTSDQIISATLTGTLMPVSAVNVFAAGVVTLSPAFTATILPSTGSNLSPGDPTSGTLGDFALIQAQTQSSSSVPEPTSGTLLLFGLFALTGLPPRWLCKSRPS